MRMDTYYATKHAFTYVGTYKRQQRRIHMQLRWQDERFVPALPSLQQRISTPGRQTLFQPSRIPI
jgi:hypothetical protein